MGEDFGSEKNLIWCHSKLWYNDGDDELENQSSTEFDKSSCHEKEIPPKKKLSKLWDHSERRENVYQSSFPGIDNTHKPSVTFNCDLHDGRRAKKYRYYERLEKLDPRLGNSPNSNVATASESPKGKKVWKPPGNMALCKDDVYWLNKKNSLESNEPLLVYMFIEGKHLHVGPLQYNIHKDMTVKTLKMKVCRDFEIRTPIQKLILANILVSDEDKKIGEFPVLPASSIFLYLELSESESHSVFKNLCEKIKFTNFKKDIKTNNFRFQSYSSEMGIESLNKISNSVSSTLQKNRSNNSSYESHRERNETGKKLLVTNSYKNIDKLALGLPIRPDSVSSDKPCRRRTLPEFKIFKSKFDYRSDETLGPGKSLILMNALKASKKRKTISNETESHYPSDENVMKVPEHLADSYSSDNNSTGYVTVSSSNSSLYTDKEGITECSDRNIQKIFTQKAAVYALDGGRNSDVEESPFATSERTLTEDESLLCSHFNTIFCLDVDKSEVSQNFSETSQYQSERERQSYGILLELEELNLISNAEPFECAVCLCMIGTGEGVLLRDCLHTFCKECLSSTVVHSTESFVKCPYRDECYTCRSNLQQREIKALVSQEVFEQYLQRSLNAAENTAKGSFHCKTADCPGWCLYEDNANIFCCPVCSHYNCLTCQAVHEGLNCLQYQDKLREKAEINEDAKKTLEFLEKMVEEGKAMKCPSCCITLMKKWGCDWLKCSVCGTEVCWVTKGPRWGPNGTGDTSGGCKCGVGGKKCHPSCVYCH